MNPNQSQQRYARTVRLLQVVLLLLIFAVLGVAGTALMNGPRLFFPPTPTLTATPRAELTPTPDFRTTLIAEDVATQQAYATLVVESGGLLSPLGIPTTATVAVAAALTPTATVPLDVTPTPDLAATSLAATAVVTISLPLVNFGESSSVLPTPTETPLPGALPSDTPTATLPPDVIPTETPSPTLPPLPTETPTPTPTFLVATLRSFVTVTPGATTYNAPSSQATPVAGISFNQEVTLSGRDETGEWLFGSANSQSFWVRHAYVVPRDNALPVGAPTNAAPNDVRWLAMQPAPALPTPILTPTPIPLDQYPFYRYERGNNSRVANLPQPPWQSIWPMPSPPRPAMNYAVLVNANFVIAGSQSGANNQLYGLNRFDGNLAWVVSLPQAMVNAPVVQENLLYALTANGIIYALDTATNPVQQFVVAQLNTTAYAAASLYLAQQRLYILTQEADGTRHLRAVDRTTNTLLNEQYIGTSNMAPHLAVGNQSLYIGDPMLRALDSNKLDLIWQQPDVPNLNTAPLYVTNGPLALAELYVANVQNELYLLNANTGQILWRVNPGVLATGMAVSEENLYVSGNGYVLAMARRTGTVTWRAAVNGSVMGGPIVDADQVLVVTNLGEVRMFNRDGAVVNNFTLPNGAQVLAPPAVSGPYIYIPANDGAVYALRGQ